MHYSVGLVEINNIVVNVNSKLLYISFTNKHTLKWQVTTDYIDVSVVIQEQLPSVCLKIYHKG